MQEIQDKREGKNTTVQKLLESFIYPWEMEGGLASIAEIQDMSANDLLEAHLEFENLLSGDNVIGTFYEILEETEYDYLKRTFADRNLSKTTMKDIRQALDFIKFK